MKRLLVIAVIMLVSSSLYAFNAGNSVLYPSAGVGISTGSGKAATGATVGELSFSDPSYFNNPDAKTSLAWNAGGSFDHFLTNNLALSGGLFYESTPFKTVYPKNTAPMDLEITYNFTFLSIPVGVRYYFEYLMIGGGAYISKVLSDDYKVTGALTESGNLDKTKYDIGMWLDLGVSFNLSATSNLLIFGRYKRGFTKVYKEDAVVTDIKTASLTLNVAFGIRL